jgi:hypothetical protein
MSGQFVPEHRDLSAAERALLLALLATTEAGRADLSQVSDVAVVRRCGCGCRTVENFELPTVEQLDLSAAV